MQELLGKHGGQRILVVESDPAAAERLSGMIAGMSTGHEVVRACSGFEALQKAENSMVNVVLAAEKLADMTGSTLISIVQGLKKSRKKEPACVLMTENGRRVNNTEINCPAAFDVIRRPVGPDELVYALDRAMDRDGLKAKIHFNRVVQGVLLALIPVAVILGMMVGH
jgi:CheY-like chemotaxis protein